MRTQKGLRLVEALLILVALIIIGNVGCSRQEAKSLDDVGSASESRGEQDRRQKGRPKEADETTNWVTCVNTEGRFSLRHPRYWVRPAEPEYCNPGLFMAGADEDSVGECASENFGQIYVLSEEGNQLGKYMLATDEYPYQNLTSQKVTVD